MIYVVPEAAWSDGTRAFLVLRYCEMEMLSASTCVRSRQ